MRSLLFSKYCYRRFPSASLRCMELCQWRTAPRSTCHVRGDCVDNLKSSSRHYSSVSEDAIVERTERLLELKAKSGKTFDEIAGKLGLTNVYTTQLFLGQAKLTPESAAKLKEVLPDISDQDLQQMQQSFPMRNFDDDLLKEPNTYRLYEAICHNGEAIKSLINEQCGDGIMSAIDFYLDVDNTTGVNGEKRVVVTFNGKFLPFIEQKSSDNTAVKKDT